MEDGGTEAQELWTFLPIQHLVRSPGADLETLDHSSRVEPCLTTIRGNCLTPWVVQLSVDWRPGVRVAQLGDANGQMAGQKVGGSKQCGQPWGNPKPDTCDHVIGDLDMLHYLPS